MKSGSKKTPQLKVEKVINKGKITAIEIKVATIEVINMEILPTVSVYKSITE